MGTTTASSLSGAIAGAFDLSHRRAYAITVDRLHSFDMTTPLISEIRLERTGDVEPFSLASMAFDPVVQRLYLLTTDGRILTAETDGTRLLSPLTVFTAHGELGQIGTGEPLEEPTDLTLSLDGNEIYAIATRTRARRSADRHPQSSPRTSMRGW
jgi:hypothetical protein